MHRFPAGRYMTEHGGGSVGSDSRSADPPGRVSDWGCLVPILLEIGFFVWAAMLAVGYALLRCWARHWARVEERQVRLWRVRELTERLLRQQADRVLDSDPRVSLNGLRMLVALRKAGLTEPEDEDFAEEIATVVVMSGSGRVVRGGRSADRWIVPDHKALAARLAVDIAIDRGRPPNTIAQWIVGLPTSGRSRPTLRRTA
jgi:hypothetical protein